jgi:hypothetical protein
MVNFTIICHPVRVKIPCTSTSNRRIERDELLINKVQIKDHS